MDNLEYLILHIKGIIIAILADEHNKFDKLEFQVTSRLLWAIDMYPVIRIPTIMLGIHCDYDENNFYDLVISLDEDELILSKIGSEGSEYYGGTYSYNYVCVWNKDAHNAENIEYELGRLEDWYHEAYDLIGNEETSYTIECWEPECIFPGWRSL
jgi:hypothetical protein